MTSKKKLYPHWAFPSRRAFQRRKRADIRKLLAAIKDTQNGIAYVPGYREHWTKIMKHAAALAEGARPRNWK